MSDGFLYQLYSERQLQPGDYVAVNGPWDKYGVVRKSTISENGQYLNLIRGVPRRIFETPVAQF